MAAITTAHLLYVLRRVCNHSALVHYIEERILDIDILHVRVHLTMPETFINIYYTLETDKTAFALVQTERRVYGVDNAKTGWHRHPFTDPDRHIICSPVTFSEFLRAVEKYFND
ncbi:MAG: hypothetical protein ABIG63_04340 [Chloroflexota bacterium]